MKTIASVVVGTAILAWFVVYFLSGFSPSVETLSDAEPLRDAKEVELVTPIREDSSVKEISARVPAQRAPAAEPLVLETKGSLALRLGARPEGTETVFGKLLPPRRASDEDDAPEWYVQDRVLAVTLTSRGGDSPPPESFVGGKEHAAEPLTVEWKNVSPGTYDITVELRSDAGHAETQLTGIVVVQGATEQDPKLTAWDPIVDFDVMRLFIEIPKDREAKSFVIGTSEADEGRALACERRLLALEEEVEVHGPYFVVHDRGHPALVHALEELSGEVIVPHRPHDRRVSLPERVPAGLKGRVSPDGLDPAESHGATLRRVPPIGEWRLPIPTVWIATSHLPSPGYAIPISVPAEGLYRWVADKGEWSSSPFEIKREDKPPIVDLAVTRLP